MAKIRSYTLPLDTDPDFDDVLWVDKAGGSTRGITLSTLDAKLNAGLYNVAGYGALGDGVTDDTSAIDDAYTAAAAADGGIYFPLGTYLMSTLVFASGVGLTFAAGAMLTIPTGENVTINGAISAGDQQIFTGDGSVHINNATGINAMWFGVSAANAAADNDAAFARLLRSFPAANATTFDAYNVPSTTTGQVVKLPEGIIEISATVDITNIGGLTMHGADAPGSHGSTFLAWTGAAAGTMVLMDGTPGSAIGYMHLLGRGIANVGLLLDRSSTNYVRSFSTFSNLTISDCAVAGIQISSAEAQNQYQVDNIQFYNTLINRCYCGVFLNNRNNLDIHFFTLRVVHNGQAGGIGGIVPTYALWIKYGACTVHGFDFGGPSGQDFADYPIYLQNGSVQVFGGYTENGQLIKGDSVNPSGAIDTTGETTTGSYTITGMTDTSDFAVMDRVTVDKGMGAWPCDVISKTADSLTVSSIGTSDETGVTVRVSNAVDTAVVASTFIGFNQYPSTDPNPPLYTVHWDQGERAINFVSSRIGNYMYEGTLSGGINLLNSQFHNVPAWTGRTKFSSVHNTRVIRSYAGTGTDYLINWDGLTGFSSADTVRDIALSNNFYRRDDYLMAQTAGTGSILRLVDGRLILYQLTADTAGQIFDALDYAPYLFEPTIEAGYSSAKNSHFLLGGKTFTFHHEAPTAGTWTKGSIIFNSAVTAGQSMGWMCILSGSFGGATDSTGVTAIGSYTITGVTDTSDFNVGDWVTVDKGIQYHPGPFEILGKTASTITVNVPGDSVETNVTITANDPLFEAMPVLPSGHPVVTLGADAGALLGISGQELSLDTQTANTVFAGPASGAAADPTFRALTLDDMPAGIGGSDATDILYADLVTAIAGDDLVPLAWYRITDFATVHYIVSADPNVQYIDVGDIITGANEPLLVQAITTNELGAQAISESYPQDIIRYDWDPDNYYTDPSIWEQGGPTLVTGFKGVITFRHDTVSDNYAYYDFRNAKTRRWALLVDPWSAGSYAAGSYVTHLDYLWYAVITTSGVPGTSHDWAQLLPLNSGLIDNYWLPWLTGLPADPDDYVDVLTFQDLATSTKNHLGKGPLACGQLSTFDTGAVNNVIAYPSSHTLGTSCVGNQLGASCERGLFANDCVSNDIGMFCADNLFGPGVTACILAGADLGNILGASCAGLLFLGGNVNNNVFADGCSNITLGPGKENMVFTYQTANRSYFAGHTYAELDSTGADAGDVLTADGSGNSAWAAPGAVGGAVPVGGIIMWSGTVATIPANWALCNGSNSTPDLRDRFIVGAKQDDSGVAKTNLTGSLTASGGSVSHHHADHAFTQPSAHSNHTFTQPTAHGTLTHTTGNDSSTTGGTAKVVATTHTLTNNHSGGAVDAHSAHSGGAVDAHDTLSAPQPYYALAFIMRTA